MNERPIPTMISMRKSSEAVNRSRRQATAAAGRRSRSVSARWSAQSMRRRRP